MASYLNETVNVKPMNRYILLILVLFTGCKTSTSQAPPDISPNPVIPSANQVAYQEMELIGFIHFGVNTFTDREWGTGKESPEIFNPTGLDAGQWVKVAKEAGIKQLIITAKHHDGFCLWPSKFTSHSVRSGGWENGRGDVLKDLSEACRKEGLKMGLYLSPWDMHEPSYGTAAYNQYYLNQLQEILTQYGPVSEVWMDGAKGENAKDMEYDFNAFRALIYKLQPGALIFSDAGPDIRWIGNENGIAGETNWSMIKNDGIVIGKADAAYLNRGDPEGNRWIAGECDVSIRPGWFYHASQDDKVKSPMDLVDLYYKSVGRNGTLLLNIPPDKLGRWAGNDVKNLLEFRSILDETFSVNLAQGKNIVASGYRSKNDYFSPRNVADTIKNSYWATDDGIIQAWLEIDLEKNKEFDRIMIQEPVRFGQRISSFRIDVMKEVKWKTVSKGTTIGYKRLLRINPITTDKVRLVIENANNIPAISNFGLFKSSSREPHIID
jgi:alpha-L-fucosidase